MLQEMQRDKRLFGLTNLVKVSGEQTAFYFYKKTSAHLFVMQENKLLQEIVDICFISVAVYIDVNITFMILCRHVC